MKSKALPAQHLGWKSKSTTFDRNECTVEVLINLSPAHTRYLEDASGFSETESRSAGTDEDFVIRSCSPKGDLSRVIENVGAVRYSAGTTDRSFNWKNVVNGESSEDCELTPALGDAFLSIAIPGDSKTDHVEDGCGC
jgi:hypothetical protein